MLATVMDVELEHRKVAAAKAMVEPLRQAAGRAAEERAMPRETLDRLRVAGLLNLLRPQRFGGEGVSLRAAIRTCRELALGDASAAWVHGVYTTHDHLIGLFSDRMQEDYWGSAETPLIASSIVPTGKARPVEGGYELDGNWSFCSGIDHANWVVLGAFVGMLPGEHPIPDRRFFMVPQSDYSIVDDWHVLGLRGTGSKSIVLERVFVPHERILADADISAGSTPGGAGHDAPEYRYPTWPLLNFTLVGLAARIAQNAYEQVLADLTAGLGKPNPLFDARRPAAQMHLAEASAKIDAADLIYTHAFDETFAVVDAGEPLTLAQRVRNRRNQCYAARLAHEASTILLGIGGARGIREGGAVQRAQRDLTALTLHPGSNWDSTALSFGNVELGGQPSEPIF